MPQSMQSRQRRTSTGIAYNRFEIKLFAECPYLDRAIVAALRSARQESRRRFNYG